MYDFCEMRHKKTFDVYQWILMQSILSYVHYIRQARKMYGHYEEGISCLMFPKTKKKMVAYITEKRGMTTKYAMFMWLFLRIIQKCSPPI
jgi:hypothetical protein